MDTLPNKFKPMKPPVLKTYLCASVIRWKAIQTLNECREAPGSAVFSNSNEEDFLLVTGGYNGKELLATVESIRGGSSSNQTNFADLPTAIRNHCTVKINETFLLQIGGTESISYDDITRKTNFFDIVGNRWIAGPLLNVGRIYHSCALMIWENPKTGNTEQVKFSGCRMEAH
jgi:hypothetical protein